MSLKGGVGPGDAWAPNVGNSWRTTSDIQDHWASMISNIDRVNIYIYPIPENKSRFHVLRILILLKEQDQVVGMIPIVGSHCNVYSYFLIFVTHLVLEIGNGHMTDVEYVTHFSLWSLAKAPLIIGCDVRKITAAALSILTNPEVIAVNQDPLGVQGTRVASVASQTPDVSGEVIVANFSLPDVDPKRYQWTYNSEDGSIQSVYNGRCVSIDSCNTAEGANVVLNDCHINDPQAPCQGKNQQWVRNATNETFVSQLNGKW